MLIPTIVANIQPKIRLTYKHNVMDIIKKAPPVMPNTI